MRNNKSFTSHIPNLITTINLLLGCISVACALQDELILASLLIFAAGILDFLDGVAARLLHAYSEFGKMLDSLADAVSFGVAPSFILFELLNASVIRNSQEMTLSSMNWVHFLVSYTAFIIAVFSALRLAKFNIDERQTSSFIGLPTPANAFLIASIPIIINDNETLMNLVLRTYVLIPLIFILSFLLISEIPMISLKFKNLSFKDNKSRFILILASLLLLIFLKITAIPFIFVLYLSISLIDNPQKQPEHH
jgi:CDP-diacylglycerol---serine O-phosphatidyltransferase